MIHTYHHHWNDHDTFYLHSAEGLCKVNVYDEGYRKVAELYDLIVFPEYRGKGFGRLLLETAVSVVREHRCDVLVLWPDSEAWVVAWYKRFGFRPDASCRNYDDEMGWSIDLNQINQ